MIGYFLKADESGGRAFREILGFKGDLGGIVKQKLRHRKFSDNFDLILIQFHVESPLSLGIPKEITVGPISRKTRSLSIKIPVKKDVAYKDIDQVRDYIVNATCEALDILDKRVGNKLDIRIDELKKSFVEIAKERQSWESERNEK